MSNINDHASRCGYLAGCYCPPCEACGTETPGVRLRSGETTERHLCETCAPRCECCEALVPAPVGDDSDCRFVYETPRSSQRVCAGCLVTWVAEDEAEAMATIPEEIHEPATAE